jgi:phosphoribosylformylglycinamidine (FGAM) synthase-like amidotransferase family enzyme
MRRKIALFVHQPKCSVQSINGIMKALTPNYDFKIYTKHEVEDDFFDDVDMVAFPGGVGDSDSWDNLLKHHRKRIHKFIDHGGRYLGICMGAYWAGPDYFNILPDVKIDQYIKRPNTCTRRPHAKAMEVEWLGNKEKMFFYDGCTIEGNDMDVVATYPNGDVMAAVFDKRIGLIGCHPESEKHWYDSYSWMPKHWHNNTHGKLLLDFVDNLWKVG